MLHTGGTILNTLSARCQSDEGLFNASGDPLAMIIECSTNEECITGSVSIGPVTTGMNYSCVVTADNNIGEDEMMTNNILTNTGELLLLLLLLLLFLLLLLLLLGIPSVPVVINVTGGAGVALITLRVDNFGVTMANDFTFIVSVFDQDNLITTRPISPDSINSPVITLLVDNLPAGMLTFTVSSSNVYGTPLVTSIIMTDHVTVQSSEYN